MAPQIVSTTPLYTGWSKLLLARIRLPDGQTITREIEHHGSAAAVLPYDAERRTAILVRQFRPALMHAAGLASSLEAIAGIVDEADPQVTARREALEEAGLALDALEFVGTLFAMPGLSTEQMSLFLAPYRTAARVAAGGGVATEHEQIVVEEVELAQLAAMADGGTLPDLKTFALIQTLRLRQPSLFAD